MRRANLEAWIAFAAISGMAGSVAASPVSFIGTGRLSGVASDGLSLTPPLLEDGVTPHDQVGGFGSALAYTGVNNLYLATPDRGPADGATSYQDRYYVLEIAVDPQAAVPVAVSLEHSTLLVDEQDRGFTGALTAFDTGLRFDAEGVRLDGQGGFFVSDEYGPYIYRFAATGQRIGTVSVPPKFCIARPASVANDELPPGNLGGRQANRGMEGLAISPDGAKLFGAMQNALIQDGALDESNARIGENNRILAIDTATGQTREYVYTLSSKKYGVNELLAINDHELLVLERDGKAGAEATFKQLFKIDLNGATDVSAIAALPTSGLPEGVLPVQKTAFLDLLAPEFGLAGDTFPEKIEGIAFGPKLADGRLVLLVTSDNDFVAANDSLVYAFAIDPSALAFQPQALTVPMRALPTAGSGGSGSPVAILGQLLLPVSAIDVNSLRIGGAPVAKLGKRTLCVRADVNHDSLQDLLCAFKQTAASSAGDLSGQTTSGSPLRGLPSGRP